MARANASEEASRQREAAVNRRSPDVGAIMSNAQANAGGGSSSTMLTGPGGASTAASSLGGSSLLGG
jgi:hypothetical protein